MKNSVTRCTQWNTVTGMGLAAKARTTVVTVPVIVNTRKICKGDEVVVKCAPPPPKAKKLATKKRKDLGGRCQEGAKKPKAGE